MTRCWVTSPSNVKLLRAALILAVAVQLVQALLTTFSCSSSSAQFTVPVGVQSLTVTACGAAGATVCSNGCQAPGAGGCIQASIPTTPGQTLYVFAGCSTGFNAYSGTNSCQNWQSYAHVQPGGGGSDVRTSLNDLQSRLTDDASGSDPTEVQGSLPVASISSTSALEPTEVAGLEAMKNWLVETCGLTPRSGQRVAELLFLDKGCASVEALSQRVARNRAYLTEAGVGEDDAKQISAGLSTMDEAGAKGLEALRAWLGSRCDLTPAKAALYAQVLFLEKGVATPKVLSQRVASNASYLTEAGVEENDAKQISAAFSTIDEADAKGLETLRTWLSKCDLTAKKAADYAKILYVDKGCASVKALSKRLERNPRYLVDVAGLDADDSDEIVKALQGKKGASRAWGRW